MKATRGAYETYCDVLEEELNTLYDDVRKISAVLSGNQRRR